MSVKINLFTIEILDKHYKYYRYRSLVNSSKGAWCETKEKAIEQCKKHQTIMIVLHPKLKRLINEP